MLMVFVVVLLFLAVFYLAARAKRVNNRYRSEQAVESPMTEAIGQLIGIAGGIYLSLVMTASFLGLEVPERLLLWGCAVDPLAVVSIALALVQPLLLCLLRRIFG